jgi:hypothetical protein
MYNNYFKHVCEQNGNAKRPSTSYIKYLYDEIGVCVQSGVLASELSARAPESLVKPFLRKHIFP